MNLVTITAIDRNSSETTTKTFGYKTLEELKNEITEWESELPYTKYELMTMTMGISSEIEELLDELEVTF